MPGDPLTCIATNMTLLPGVPVVHGPFVLRLSRHLSRLMLKGVATYRRLGAVLPLFTEKPSRLILGNRASGTGASRRLAAGFEEWHHTDNRVKGRTDDSTANQGDPIGFLSYALQLHA